MSTDQDPQKTTAPTGEHFLNAQHKHEYLDTQIALLNKQIREYRPPQVPGEDMNNSHYHALADRKSILEGLRYDGDLDAADIQDDVDGWEAAKVFSVIKDLYALGLDPQVEKRIAEGADIGPYVTDLLEVLDYGDIDANFLAEHLTPTERAHYARVLISHGATIDLKALSKEVSREKTTPRDQKAFAKNAIRAARRLQ